MFEQECFMNNKEKINIDFGEKRFYVSVLDHGIQSAIDECDRCGGGSVIIPKGTWKTGPIHMHSNICLVLEEGARVHFSDDPEEYLPVVFTRWEGFECFNYSPLIYAIDCENIGITGKGTFYGHGEQWWFWRKRQKAAAEELGRAQSEGIPVEQRIYGTQEAALRPSFFQPVRCRNVLVEGVTFIDGPQWTLHPVYCEHVTFSEVTVESYGPNTDGLNPDSCSDVLIEKCSFHTGDDCIAINSGMNEDGWRVGIPCRDIEIRNCVMTGGHGAVVIGSGMSGGVENVYVHHCRVSNTMQGIRLKSMRGRGGYVSNVLIEDIEINDVSNEAIQINMFYEFTTVEPLTTAPSDFRNITIRRILGANAETGITINGLPEHPLDTLLLENIHLTADKSMECSNVSSLTLRNVEIGRR